ncbi:MAG TPA: M56 family metallopeptidase, partial [Allosphingosinicella sp.]
MTAAFALLVDIALKGSLVCLLALLLTRLLRSRSASLRHDLLAAALGCCALLAPAILIWWAVGLRLSFAPVHEAVMAITPHLPAATPTGMIEVVDQIWSGDGGSALTGRGAAALVALWLGGAAVQLLRSLASHRAAAALARRAVPFGGAGRAQGIALRITNELSGPAAYGLRAPVILLPAGAEHWPAERLDAVLAHEAEHVRRRDAAVETMVQLAVAVHWFNPLVLGAARRLRDERELACDARVVEAGLDPASYADALVQSARDVLGPSHHALLAMARQPELERRVRLLVGGRGRGVPPSGYGGALAGAMLFACLTLGLVSAPASGVLAAGSVQPEDRPLGGLDDPMSELVPLDYQALAAAAAAVPAQGAEARAIAALKDLLGHRGRGYGDLVRERTIWALTRIRGGRLFEPLSDLTGDADWRVRAYAAWGLAAADDQRATPVLLALLDDPVWRVRAMAAAALARLGDPRAAPHLVRMVRDPAWQVRISAIAFAEKSG